MYSRMDQVKFVKDSLENFTWFILEYLDPNNTFLNRMAIHKSLNCISHGNLTFCERNFRTFSIS